MDRRRPARGALSFLVVQGVLATDLTQAADIVLPGASPAEKEAAYTNESGPVQGTASRSCRPATRGRLDDPARSATALE